MGRAPVTRASAHERADTLGAVERALRLQPSRALVQVGRGPECLVHQKRLVGLELRKHLAERPCGCADKTYEAVRRVSERGSECGSACGSGRGSGQGR